MRTWQFVPEMLSVDGTARTEVAAVEASGEASTLVIGSWNVKRLGHGTKDLSVVADVIDDFDIVAVQEVMTREVVEALSIRVPTHRVLLTDTPTPVSGSYREYFAFFYDPAKLEPTFNTFVPDPRDAFFRDPYLACFTVIRSRDRLCLMTLHVVWGDRVAERKAEIKAVDDALRWAQSIDETSSWIILGDFNRPVDDGDADVEPEEEWLELLDRQSLRAPVVLAGQEIPTTIAQTRYANAYDHIFVSATIQNRVVRSGRLDIVATHCAGQFDLCRATVSDHAPVYVEWAPTGAR